MQITFGATAKSLLGLALVATVLPAQQTTNSDQASTTSITDAAPGAPDSTPAHANAKVRIVRLSEVKGDVQLDRSTGVGFEEAMTNIPIIEHARLQTGVGVAEVEFEDNSTLRVGADSLVAFPQLDLLPSGAKASTVTVMKGTVYVSLLNTKGNEFTLAFGQRKVHLQPSSHIRLQLEPAMATLSVEEGAALVEGPAGTTEVGKKKTFSFAPENGDPLVAAKYVPSEPFDSWDQKAAEYHKNVVAKSALASTPYSYGISDMMYYGNFVNAPGCGSMWQPYFVSAGWSPFNNGTWAYYPGAGYSWVSPYPWGWTPFHYGSWTNCPGAGWGWQPGGAWNGLGNVPVASTTSGLPLQLPHRPTHTPLSGASLVQVNLKPIATSDFGSTHETFVFRNDSAGMGIPRGNFGKLDGYSSQAAHHGTANANVYGYGAPAAGGGHPAYAGQGPSERAGSGQGLGGGSPSSTARAASGSPGMSSGPSFGSRSAGAPVSSPVGGATSGGGRPH